MSKQVKKVKAWAVVYNETTVVDPNSIRYIRPLTEKYLLDYRLSRFPESVKARIVCIDIPTVPLTPKKKASRK